MCILYSLDKLLVCMENYRHLDWHSCAVEGKGKETALAFHALITDCKLDEWSRCSVLLLHALANCTH